MINKRQAMKTDQMPCIWFNTSEWVRKMWYLYAMKYYSVRKKTEVLSFTGKWMEMDSTILNNVSQIQKDKGGMFSLICERPKYKYKHYHICIYIYTFIYVYIIYDIFLKEGLKRRKHRDLMLLEYITSM
jgi:hypothetical protein